MVIVAAELVIVVVEVVNAVVEVEIVMVLEVFYRGGTGGNRVGE